jgi:O-antigen/teichoic acid export membrane protein
VAAGAVLRRALTAVMRWQALVLGAAAVAAYPLVQLMHIRHALPPAATAVAVTVGVVMPVALGGLQAHERFAALSLVQFLYAGLKFPACLGMLALGLGVSGVMIGIALATGITVAVALWLLRDTVRAARRHVSSAPTALVRDSGLAAVSLTLWTVAANADLLAARLVLPPHTAGPSAAASTAATLVFAAPAVATTVLFPRVARLASSLREREHLVLGVRFVALFAAVGVTLAFVVPRPLIELTLGEKYTAAAPWLGWLAVAMSLFALVYVYVVHVIALGHSRFPLFLAGAVAVEVALFAAMHASVHELLVAELLSAGTLVVCAELYDRLRAG